MDESPGRAKDPPVRWDAVPLPGKFAAAYAAPWDAGIRRWPGIILLVTLVGLFVVLGIVFGATNGEIAAGVIASSYALALILAPNRRRLVPREIGDASSSSPLRLWVLGGVLVGAACWTYPIAMHFDFTSDRLPWFIVPDDLWFGLAIAGMLCIQIAPTWERSRNRRRIKIASKRGD
jgi:hypothetical protein